MKKLLLALLLIPALAEAQTQINYNEPTAARRRIPVRLVDVTDGETEETAIAIAAGECKTIEGGASSPSSTNCAGTLTHVANGNYYYELAQAETDNCGIGWIYINDAAAKPFTGTFQVNCFQDGVTTSESGTTIGLASGAIDADDQFTEGFSIYFYNQDGPVGSACIVDSANTGDTIVTAVNLSAVHTTGDSYIIKPDALCRVRSELASLPGTATYGLADALSYLYQLFRFKLDQSSTEQKLYKDDGSTVLETKTVGVAGGTVTKGEGS